MSDPEVNASDVSVEPVETIEQKAPIIPKKNVDEKRLEQLARARLRAAQVNRERAQQRLRDKVHAMDGAADRSEPRAEVAKMKTATRDTQPIVVVEQSDSDEDQFEAPGVVFVRRKRSKPAVPEKSAEELQMDKLYSHMFG